MNSLFIFNTEVTAAGRSRIMGQRAAAVQERHQFRTGQRTKVGIQGCGLGSATVTTLSENQLELEFEITEPNEQPSNHRLIVGVCRPQTVRKVLSLAAELGVARVDFIRTELTDKSYLGSSALSPAAIEEQLVLGVEQGYGSYLPEVRVFHRFKPFIDDVLALEIQSVSNQNNGASICATIGVVDGAPMHTVASATSRGSYFLAIGPELGWNSFEIESFEKLGFLRVGFGKRVLRVEHACAFGLAQQIYLKGCSAPQCADIDH